MPSKTAAEPKVSVVDAMAEDANPPTYPEGAPELLPYLQIRPRSKRAEFKRRWAALADKQRQVQGLTEADRNAAEDVKDDPAGAARKLRLWAEADELYQLMDEVMEFAAVDPVAYRTWADESEDDDLAKVYNVFMARSQPGEASSSAS